MAKHIGLLVLLLALAGAGCKGSSEPPRPQVKSLQVSPRAVILSQPGVQRVLRVQAYGADGHELEVGQSDIEWVSSHPDLFQIVQASEDPSALRVTSSEGLGTAVVTVRLRSNPQISSEPLLITSARTQQDVLFVEDPQVVFPPPNVPEGADLAEQELPELDFSGEEARFGSFSESEVAALYALPESGGSLRYGVVLKGGAPAPGTLLLASGGADVAGRVLSSQARDGFALIQLELPSLTELFKDFVFNIRSEDLAKAGQLSPWDTGSWATDELNMVEQEPEQPDTPLQAQSLAASAGAGWTCKSSAGVKLVRSPKVIDGYLGPIWDSDISIQQGAIQFFYFKVGVTAKAQVNPEIHLQAGGKKTLECRPQGIKRSLPLGGPLSLVLAPYLEAYPLVRLGGELSAGPELAFGLKAGFEASVWTGMTYRAGQGWTSLCNSWEECHSRQVESELIKRWPQRQPQLESVTFKGSAGLYLTADVGFIAGGRLLDWVGSWAQRIPILAKKANALVQGASVPVLQAKVGPETATQWANQTWVLNNERTEAAANTWLKANLVLKLDLLKPFLRKLLSTNMFNEWEVASLPEVDLLPPYYSISEETLTVNGQRYYKGISAPVLVRRGQTLAVDATLKRDVLWLSPLRVLLNALGSPHESWPHRGELYLGEQKLTELTGQGGTRLVGQLPITQELCEAAHERIQLKLVGYNKMWFGFETPNYMGDFEFTCGAVTLEPASLGLHAKAGQSVSGSSVLLNTGPQLQYSAQPTSTLMALTSGASGVLEPAQSVTLQVKATCPTNPGLYSGAVVLSFQDALGRPVTDGVPRSLPVSLSCEEDRFEPCGDCVSSITAYIKITSEGQVTHESTVTVSDLKFSMSPYEQTPTLRMFRPVTARVSVRGYKAYGGCTETFSGGPVTVVANGGVGEYLASHLYWNLSINQLSGTLYAYMDTHNVQVCGTSTQRFVARERWYFFPGGAPFYIGPDTIPHGSLHQTGGNNEFSWIWELNL